jgi:hypothetical protein
MTNNSFEGVIRYRVLRGGPGEQYLEDGPTKKKKEMIWSSREGSRRNYIKSAAAVDAEERDSYPRESREGVKREGSMRKFKKSGVVGAAENKGIGLRRKSSGKSLSADQDQKDELLVKSNDRSLILGIVKAAIAEDRKYIESLKCMIEAAYTIQRQLKSEKNGDGLRRKSSGRLLSKDQDEKDKVSGISNDRSLRKSRSRRSCIDAEVIDPGLQAVLDIVDVAIADDRKRVSEGGGSLKSMIEAADPIQGELEAKKKGIDLRRKSSGKLLSVVDQDERDERSGALNDLSLRKSRSRRSCIDAEDIDSGLQGALSDVAKAAIADHHSKRASAEGGGSLKSKIEAAGTIQEGELEAEKKGIGLRRKSSGKSLSADQDQKDELLGKSNDRSLILGTVKAAIAEDRKYIESLKCMIEAAHTIQGKLKSEKNGDGLRRKSSGRLLSKDQDEKDEVSGISNDRSLRKSRSRTSCIDAEDIDPGLQAVLDIVDAAIAEDRKRVSEGGGSLKSMIEAADPIQGDLDATDGKIIDGDSVLDDGHAASVGTPHSGRNRSGMNAHLDGFDSKTSPKLSPKSVISNESPYQLGAYESPNEKNIRPSGRLGFSLPNLQSCFLPVYSALEEDGNDSEDSTSQFSNGTKPPKAGTLLEPKEQKRPSSLTPKTGRKGSRKAKFKEDAKKKDSTDKNLARSAASTMEAKNEEIKQVQLRISTALQTAKGLAHSKLEMKSELDDLRLECENSIASLFAHFAAASSQ